MAIHKLFFLFVYLWVRNNFPCLTLENGLSLSSKAHLLPSSQPRKTQKEKIHEQLSKEILWTAIFVTGNSYVEVQSKAWALHLICAWQYVVYNHVLVIGVEGRTFLHLRGGLTYAGKRFARGLALWAKMVPVWTPDHEFDYPYTLIQDATVTKHWAKIAGTTLKRGEDQSLYSWSHHMVAPFCFFKVCSTIVVYKKF